jgi:hypothetical protein
VLDRAKAATVFVQVRSASYLDPGTFEESSGTGFFISPEGRVATCWHVLDAARSSGSVSVPLRADRIQVFVRSGKRDQQVLPARVLAADPVADLAVLKIEPGDRPVPWLPLGETASLTETTPLWVLGFPLGKLFSVLQRGPELSVNGGEVSSLRHDDLGRLQSIQFDAVVISGNSGGPVITTEGRVAGVANIALGTSRVNFGIPVERLRQLLADCPLDKGVGDLCSLSVRSEPPGAEAWLDEARLGTTPLRVRTRGGYRRLVLTAPGRRSWSTMLAVHDGREVRAELPPLKEIRLHVESRENAPPGGAPMKPGQAIFTEEFGDPRAADSWKQDTGGSDQERTWYVEEGALHQFSEDGMLHAVFAEKGGPDLADYSFAARVRIGANEKDGRAGLIFRSTDDGFALFRLHRATGKVQLAYHVNRPFGWRILDERELPFEVQAGKWYRLEVQALGDQIACLLDDQVVLAATVQDPLRGRVGFYSVDSRASFDDAAVRAVSAGERPRSEAISLRSFWFSDHFDKPCGSWQAYREGAPAQPWPTVPAGCLQLDAGARDGLNLLAAYDVRDMAVSALASCRAGTVGLAFRARGGRYYLFTVNPEKGSARLLLVDGQTRKELAAAESAENIRNLLGRLRRAAMSSAGGEGARRDFLRDIFSLYVVAEGSTLRAALNGQMLFEVTDETLASGHIGFYTDEATAVFHGLDVAYPTR